MNEMEAGAGQKPIWEMGVSDHFLTPIFLPIKRGGQLGTRVRREKDEFSSISRILTIDLILLSVMRPFRTDTDPAERCLPNDERNLHLRWLSDNSIE